MSQLPWGGKPDSPTDDPAATGPGQGADPGPEAGDSDCDCVCPNYGEQPWIPPGGGPNAGPGGDPDYTGTYYRLKRCRDNANAPAWVQSDEFAAGDVLLIETLNTKFCYYVDSVEVAAGTVQLTNVVRPNDDEETYADCTACRAVSDPEIDPGPLLPTSFAQLAFCLDDTLAPLWTPVEIFGIPVAEDLTKIYKIADVCYYVSNNIQDSPGGPLMPVFAAAIFNDCDACELPCTNCEPGVGGAAPNTGTLSGSPAGDCAEANSNQYAYESFASTANYCTWTWAYEVATSRYSVVLMRSKADGVSLGAGACEVPLNTNEWAININYDGLEFGQFSEKTTGFVCNVATGKVQGTHTFTGNCSGNCNAAITFTVPA